MSCKEAGKAQRREPGKQINTSATVPFLRLPLEVRLMIYKLVIFDHPKILSKDSMPIARCIRIRCSKKNLVIKRKNPDGTPSISRETIIHALFNRPATLAIAWTCRQSYHESIHLWYSNVRFDIGRNFKPFLNDIGRSRDLIRHVRCDSRLCDGVALEEGSLYGLQENVVACSRLMGVREMVLEGEMFVKEETLRYLMNLWHRVERVIVSVGRWHDNTRYVIRAVRDKDTGNFVFTKKPAKGDYAC